MGVGHSLVVTVLMIFLLVFATLGLGAYEIYKIRAELAEMRKITPEFNTPEKYIGDGPELNEAQDSTYVRPAAHVIGRINNRFDHSLRWEPHAGSAFINGAIQYRLADGTLQVNETGLYHVYSRVEFIFKQCPTKDFVHSVNVRRAHEEQSSILMKDHRVKAGLCKQLSLTTESYLASVVHLQQGDRLFVSASHPASRSDEHYGNFFGLYKI
ncbi:tumor necrosis factor ligand superfamily member 6 isoform X2 [Genypterus blacodes]